MQDLPAQLTATQALTRLRSGALSVEALARSCLSRIAEREAEVHAWAHLDETLIVSEARRLDQLTERGPLHGLPIGIKDVFLTRDMPTQYNSPLYAGTYPGVDAAVIKLLRAAGALILGKTATVEFGANGRSAETRNPRNLGHTPGGSSSGSAAAVADGHVPLALATQTGGSTIRPASFCGLYGMKPTWNKVSMEGAKAFAPSLDTLGWFARSAADLALLYRELSPSPAEQPAFQLAGARVGLCRSPAWPDAGIATRSALAAAAALLRQHGATVVDVELPESFASLLTLHTLIMRYEGGISFLPEYRLYPDLLHANLREMVEFTTQVSRKEVLSAYDLAARCRSEFDTFAAEFDLIVTPSGTGEAPTGLAFTGSWTFNALWTLLHAPCINVPGLLGPGGLPVGITLTGARCSDARLLAAAEAVGEIFATHH